MIKTTYNPDFFGRDLTKKGSLSPEDPSYFHQFEPSMTDQSFNYSIASKVEDFIAAGHAISAISAKSGFHEIAPENRIDSFYGDDLPVVQARIRKEADRISKLLEEEKVSEEEKKAYQEFLAKLDGI